jgi:hypothetical protein
LKKDKQSKQRRHFVIETKKEGITWQSAAEILNDGESEHCKLIARAPQVTAAGENRDRSDIT